MNSPNKGFCKYSETPGISAEEASVIEKMMKYVARPGTPRGYTDEELALHPINNSFFKLPSGRYCLAQSTYVGREDRGFANNGRFGNYLLHAYVIGDVAGMVPMSFVGDDIFRRDLTAEEWQATNPPPLPEVELPPVGKLLTPSEVSDFFDARRTEVLAALVQAIITARKTDKTVYFNDEHTNMRYWYKALAICLPLTYAGKMAFNTYSFSTQTLPSGMDPVSKLSIVNTATSLEPMIPSPTLNVQSEGAKGNFVFDFERGAFSPITAGDYALNVVKMFKSNVFEALTYAKKIDNVLLRYNCDIERAGDVLAFSEGNLEHFSTIEDILAVMNEIGNAKDPSMAANIALIAERITSGQYPFSDRLASTIKNTVYPNVNNDIKYKLIDYTFKSALSTAYGVVPAAYADSINRLMPCDKVVTAAYLYNSNTSDSILAGGDPDRVYYLLSLTLENYDALVAKYPDAVTRTVRDTLTDYVRRADTAAVDAVYSISASRVCEAIRCALLSIAGSGSLGDLSLDNFFFFTDKARADVKDSVTLMRYAIKEWGTTQEFYGRYTAYVKACPEIDSCLRSMPDTAPFFGALGAYIFEREKANLPSLLKYLSETYKDSGNSHIFENKMRQYMSTLSWQARLRDSLTIYDAYFKAKTELSEGDKRIISAIYDNVIASAPKREFVTSLISDANFKSTLEGFLQAYHAQGFSVDDNYVVIRALYSVTSQTAANRLAKAKSFELLSAIKTTSQVTIFNKELFCHYVDLMLDAYKAERGADITAVAAALIPLSFDNDSFRQGLLNLLSSADKAAKRAQEQVPVSILLYIVGRKENNDTLFKVFEEYLKTKSTKERLNLYKSALKFTDDKSLREKSLDYINAFNAKNKESFIDKLKGMFGKKQ